PALPYEIPSLIAAELVLEGFRHLRDLQHKTTKILAITDAKEAARKTNKQINRAIQQNFGNLLAPPADARGKKNQLSASNLRAAYGRIAAHYYCPPKHEPILFVAKILGHQTDNYELESLGTTISYNTYQIVDRKGIDNNSRGIFQERCDLVTEIRVPGEVL
ncbi:protelomerase family protein, partial [Anaplasma marginale]|uniref:protelomerase family protein n=1 Tax=Anaplasma marginale TaxID=770 RepID=UPI0005B43075